MDRTDPYKRGRRVNFLFNNGGLGDAIARLPAVNYVVQNHPEIIPQIWVPDFLFDFARRSLPPWGKDKFRVFKFSDNERCYDKTLAGRMSDYMIYNNLASHMTDHAFNLFVNTQPSDPRWKNYLPVRVDDINIKQFDLPEKYVVVCTGYTSPIREFIPETVNPILDYIISKGYTPVFLGKVETHNGHQHSIVGNFSTEINYSKGIDLRDKTTLLETTKIIYGAKTIVGIDNGLLHVACTHPTLPVVGGFTNVKPEHRMAYRNGVMGYNYYPVIPKEEGRCFCQSEKVFAFDHPSFTECYYEVGKRGKEISTLAALTPDLFITELEKIL